MQQLSLLSGARCVTAVLMMLGLSLPRVADAAWVQVTAKVHGINTYATTDVVLFTVENQPSVQQTPGGCSLSYFAINPTMPAERLAYMKSMLMAAKLADANVIVTYDDQAACVQYGANTFVTGVVRLTLK